MKTPTFTFDALRAARLQFRTKVQKNRRESLACFVEAA
jgi:hypothetical protein